MKPTGRRRLSSILYLLSSLSLLLLPTACDNRTGPGGDEIVVYTSVDEPVARPILQDFTRRTGIRVETRTDTEANKSAGLAARLEAEKSNPKCDVWWGNEVFRTIRLADAGVLATYESPSAKDVPPLFKDSNHLWAGNALRARVIGVRNGTANVESIEDLALAKWKGRVAIANPRAGTTSGHVAALYVLWGEPKARAFFGSLRDNGVKVLGGNGDVAAELARGTIDLGLTDNDDVENVARDGAAVRVVLPDQKSFGTLTIPCTAALVAGAKHPDAAKKLIDHLLSAQVERQLIEAKFARYSVRAGSSEGVKSMQVDYREVAKVLPRASNDAHAILVGRE